MMQYRGDKAALLSSKFGFSKQLNFVSTLAWGEKHWLLLTSSGFWYSFGWGENGRLGLGDTEDRDEPSMLYNLLDFTLESVHATSACSFAWGKIRNSMPAPITHYINATEKVTTVVDENKNLVFAWGKGDTMCLGDDERDDVTSPSPMTLSIEEDIVKIVTGHNHVLAFDKQKDRIYAWGNYLEGKSIFIAPRDSHNGSSYKNGSIKWFTKQAQNGTNFKLEDWLHGFEAKNDKEHPAFK